MSASFGFLLSDNNARRQRKPLPQVDVVLLERTLFEPPRAGAASRWGTQIRRLFPHAEVIPFAWHLLTHGPEDGLRGLSSRVLDGDPQRFGQLQPTPEVERAWDAVRPCYEALDTRRICLRTPASVTPGALGRQRLRAFVEARQKEGYAIVWEPEGLWSPAEVATLSADLGITAIGRAFVAGRPNTEPEEPEILFHRSAWLRIDAMGRRPRLSADQLDALADHAAEAPSSTFVFAGTRALPNLLATIDTLTTV